MIQFSINIIFDYKQLNVITIQLNVKTVLFQPVQFNISTQFKCQNYPISINSVYHKYIV